MSHLISNRQIKCLTSYLFSVKQSPKESLCHYIARFNREAITVSQATDEAKLMALITSLQLSAFLKTLTNFANAMRKAQKYTDFKDMFAISLHATHLDH